MLAGGIGMRFSRPIRIGTVVPGVVDLVVYEGGGGRREAWYVKQADLETKGWRGEPTLPGDRGQGRSAGGLPGRRPHPLVLRASFLLDECGRAVSGAHLGGAVAVRPALTTVADQHPKPDPLPVPSPPDRSGPWRSGNGVEGGTFESWITVDDGGES